MDNKHRTVEERLADLERKVDRPASTTKIERPARSIDAKGYWRTRTSEEARAAGVREVVQCSDGLYVPSA